MCVNGWVGTKLDVACVLAHSVAGGHTCMAAWPLRHRRPSTHNHLEMQVPGGGLQRGRAGFFLIS